jgi:nucleoside-diphosphate-sugar epimerase
VTVPYAVQVAAAVVAEIGARLTGTAPVPSLEHVRATRRYCWLYDGAKLEADVGVRPRTDLATILDGTVAWYRARGML